MKNTVRLIQHDKLVTIQTHFNGTTTRQGKRVGKDCPLTPNEVRAYVKGSAVAAVKFIATKRDIRLPAALELLQQARGEILLFKRYSIGA